MNNRIAKAYGYVSGGKCSDSQGKSIPWMTYSSIEFMSTWDMSECDVFEWGSGNSSKWFSERCKTITSVENDKEWYEFGMSNKPDNQTLMLEQIKVREIGNYANAIDKTDKKYHIIVNDGKWWTRVDCQRHLLSHLVDGGIIVLDNADWYPQLCKDLRDMGFMEIDFHGPGPINPYTWTTSLFFKNNNLLSKINTAHERRSVTPDVKTIH